MQKEKETTVHLIASSYLSSMMQHSFRRYLATSSSRRLSPIVTAAASLLLPSTNFKEKI
jgi:hypothetical protein